MKKCLRKLVFVTLIASFGGSLNAQSTPVFETASTAVSVKRSNDPVITIAKPAGTQPGDLLVAALMLGRGEKVNVSAPSGWTLIRRTNNGRSLGMAAYYRVAGVSEPETYSFLTDKKTPVWAAGISRISGTDNANPILASGGAVDRRSNVTAPSVSTTGTDSLVLSFYSNRDKSTYEPDAATIERYDEPNVATRKPSNMLATFEQAAPGTTGDKVATPLNIRKNLSLWVSKKPWVAQQIVIGGGEINLSEFDIQPAAPGAQTAGDSFELNITDAKDTQGQALNGALPAAVASNLDGLIFDDDALFTDGAATLSVTLTTPADHALAAGIEGNKEAGSLTITVVPAP